MHTVTVTQTRWNRPAKCTCGKTWRDVAMDGRQETARQSADMFRHLRDNEGTIRHE